MAVTALTPATRIASRSRALLREAVLVAALLLVYNAGRLLAGRRVSGAYDNAHRLLGVEGWLRLPEEQGLQRLVLRVPDLAQAANRYYASVHFPLTFGVLVWLFLRRPAAYLWARSALVGATAAGLLLQLIAPVAPPRMLTDLGFVDTGMAYGQSVYGSVADDHLANQFAAMPSLHVGWALLFAIVCIRTGSTRWRWAWVLHPVLTVLVVVSTGNHYWLDCLVGAVLVVAALVVAHAPPADADSIAAGPRSTHQERTL